LILGQAQASKHSSGRRPGYYSRAAILSCLLAVGALAGFFLLAATVGRSDPESILLLGGILGFFFLTGVGAGLGMGSLANSRDRDKGLPVAGLLLSLIGFAILWLIVVSRSVASR
jgi:hypothetical protein